MSSSDRYQIVDAPPRAPGQCFICRSVSRGPFVDTAVDDIALGVFYICFGCLHDIAEATDQVLIPKAEEVEPEPETDSEAYHRGFIDGTQRIKDYLDGYLASDRPRADSLPTDTGDAPIFGTPSLPVDSEGQEGSGVVSDSAAVEDGESTKRKRPARVSSGSSDGPGFTV